MTTLTSQKSAPHPLGEARDLHFERAVPDVTRCPSCHTPATEGNLRTIGTPGVNGWLFACDACDEIVSERAVRAFEAHISGATPGGEAEKVVGRIGRASTDGDKKSGSVDDTGGGGSDGDTPQTAGTGRDEENISWQKKRAIEKQRALPSLFDDEQQP